MKKPMNMAAAKLKLMQIAGNEYHAIKYQMTDTGKGSASQECSVYINDIGWHEGKTWESAFFSLQEAMTKETQQFEGLPVSNPPVKAELNN